MNRRFIAGFAVAALVIIAISFMAKNVALKRSAHLVDSIDSKNVDVIKQTLLSSAKNFVSKKEYVKAREALREYVKRFPDLKESAKFSKDIEELNMKILFSNLPTSDSASYEIKPGDTLGKIASKFNTTLELIKKSNGLESDIIMPGKALKVNTAKFTILVDKSENTLKLEKKDGEVIKTYIVSTGEDFNTPTGAFKIEEKLISPAWYKVGAIVEPNSPDYELGSRWMGLSIAGYGIHGTNDPASIGKHITKGCVRMKNEEVEELYAIVPSGTEVRIVD